MFVTNATGRATSLASALKAEPEMGVVVMVGLAEAEKSATSVTGLVTLHVTARRVQTGATVATVRVISPKTATRALTRRPATTATSRGTLRAPARRRPTIRTTGACPSHATTVTRLATYRGTAQIMQRRVTSATSQVTSAVTVTSTAGSNQCW